MILVCLLSSVVAEAQSEAGIEQYHYLNNKEAGSIVPIVHFQNKRGWYGEARYNYDDLQTFSFYGGKTFSIDNDLSYSVTPMLGGVYGRYKGGSAGLNVAAAFRSFFFNSQSQYTVSALTRDDNYFFSWVDAGYQPWSWLNAGLTLQHTKTYHTTSTFEPGVMLNPLFNKVSVPLYVFNPHKATRYYVVGFTWEWQEKPKKKLYTKSE